MSLRPILLTALAAAGLWQGFNNWQLRPVHPADGPIAPDDPRQTDVEAAQVTTLGRWRLTPRARYDITARILGRADYHFDGLSDLIPEDLALGWGPMSDNRVLQAFEITQGARFYSWRPKRMLPIPQQAVIEHSANTHVIPVDAVVARQLKRLRDADAQRHWSRRLRGHARGGSRYLVICVIEQPRTTPSRSSRRFRP
jgi:hypothetical protein